MADELVAQLELQLGGTVSALRRLSGGASRETWAFELAPSDDRDSEVSCDARRTRRLVLQRRLVIAVSSAGAEDSVPGHSAIHDHGLDEGEVLDLACNSGVPVAPVVARSGVANPIVGGLDGEWIVSERIDGETIPRRLLRDDQFSVARAVLARECGAALARIHMIDLGRLSATPVVLSESDVIANLRAALDVVGERHLVFELGLRWLELNPPLARGPALVHGDFRNGNLLVSPNGLSAVLDWELCHVGNPMSDLGWFCARPWRFGAQHHAGGFGSVGEFLDGYHDELGTTPGDRDTAVERAELSWWELMAVIRWGVICLVQAHTHLSGAVRSVELAAIGRRACEAEWDALALLGPLVGDGPATEFIGMVPGRIGHGRPTAAELVESVREFLESDVFPAAEGGVRYHTRVAIRSLQIVERELAGAIGEAGESHEGDEVVAGIRLGDHDERLAEFIRGSIPSTVSKLMVANPAYMTG